MSLILPTEKIPAKSENPRQSGAISGDIYRKNV